MATAFCESTFRMIAANLAVTKVGPGRALHLRPDGTIYASRHFSIARSSDDGRTWQPVTSLPCRPIRRLARISRLASRLLRHEVKALSELSNGELIAANREWVFFGRAGDPEMSRSRIESDGLPASPPMTLTVGPNDRILWGEYECHAAQGTPMRLFVSDDGGRSYRVARVFEGGSIRHLHNLLYDPKERVYWVLAGDHRHEPGIGRLSEDLRDFEWVQKGEQRYRAVELFDFGDRLIYGTDTEVEPNALMSLDKATGRVEKLRGFEGSCIYACRFGGLYAITTTVELSHVNRYPEAGLWLSRDGETWERAYAARKDIWPFIYLQFGSLVLPRGASNKETIVFSGQALKGIDGKLLVATLKEGSPT